MSATSYSLCFCLIWNSQGDRLFGDVVEQHGLTHEQATEAITANMDVFVVPFLGWDGAKPGTDAARSHKKNYRDPFPQSQHATILAVKDTFEITIAALICQELQINRSRAAPKRRCRCCAGHPSLAVWRLDQPSFPLIGFLRVGLESPTQRLFHFHIWKSFQKPESDSLNQSVISIGKILNRNASGLLPCV